MGIVGGSFNLCIRIEPIPSFATNNIFAKLFLLFELLIKCNTNFLSFGLFEDKQISKVGACDKCLHNFHFA